jgi:ribosome-binding factor A
MQEGLVLKRWGKRLLGRHRHKLEDILKAYRTNRGLILRVNGVRIQWRAFTTFMFHRNRDFLNPHES